jgi:integrase
VGGRHRPTAAAADRGGGGDLVDLAVAFGVVDGNVLRPTEHPPVRRRLAGRARTVQHQPERKDALVTADVIEIITALAAGGLARQLRRLRDLAIVLLAFAGGCRRSELAAVNTGATDGQIAATTGQSRGTIDGYTAARKVTANSSRLLGL